MFSTPVKETNQLFNRINRWPTLTASDANAKLKEFSNADRLRIKATIKLSHATNAGLNLFGQRILDYDMNFNLVNKVFYSPENITSTEITADIFIDRTSIEVFIDGGAYSYSMERKVESGNKEGFHFWGHNIDVKELEVFQVGSAW